jgi:regulator of cell morphogenesis and NO signaling
MPDIVMGCDRPDMPWWALDDFCDHLVRGRHASLRAAVTTLRDQFAALAHDYGEAAPTLVDASVTVETIRVTLLSHLAKEENILFPAFAALATAWRHASNAPRLPFPTVRHPISLMEAEHDRLERALARLHQLTATLALPDAAADRWEACRHALTRFERDLQSDTQVEDDVLFPRALALERALL